MASNMSTVASSVEYLVDLFVTGELDLEDFSAEGCTDDPHDAGTEERPRLDQEFLRTKIGRDLQHSGDDFNKKYKTVNHRSLADDVKELFDAQVKKAGGNPEEFWPKYKDLMDSAVRDTGLDDINKILAAVLVSVKGLAYLGSSVRTFALRYIEEKRLDEDFRKLEQNNENHPSLD